MDIGLSKNPLCYMLNDVYVEYCICIYIHITYIYILLGLAQSLEYIT